MLQAQKTFENGATETETFADYAALCQWLAASPEAGITAWDAGEALDQAQLQADVEAQG